MKNFYINLNQNASNPDGEPTVNRQSRLMSYRGNFKKLALLFAVLVMSVANIGMAWGTDYYTPSSATETIIIASGSNTMTSHSALSNTGTFASGNKKCGDPATVYTTPAATGSNVNAAKVKKDSKSIVLNISGCSEIVLCHESLSSGNKFVATITPSGESSSTEESSASTYFTTITLNAAKSYTIDITNNNTGSDYYIYAVVLKKGSASSPRTFKSGQKIYFKDYSDNITWGELNNKWVSGGGELYAYFWNDTESNTSAKGSVVSGSKYAANAIYEITVPGTGKEYTKVLLIRGASDGTWWNWTTDQQPNEGYNMFCISNDGDYDLGRSPTHKWIGTWSRYAPSPVLLGSFNNWDPDANPFGDWSSYVGQTYVELEASATDYTMKVLDGETYWGLDSYSAITGTLESGSWWLLKSGSSKKDIGLTANEDGEYVVHYNSNTHYFSVYFPKARLKKNTYIYFDARNSGNSYWNSLSPIAGKFYFKYYDTGTDQSNVTVNTPIEGSVLYTTIPNSDLIGKVQINRCSSDKSDEYSDCTSLMAGSSRSSSAENCIVIPAGQASAWSPTTNWTTYCPPMNTLVMEDNGTTTYAGDGTSGSPYIVAPSSTIKFQVTSATTIPDDPNMTKYYQFKDGASNIGSEDTETASTKTAGSNGTTHTIIVEGRNKYNSAASTIKRCTLYYASKTIYDITYNKGSNGTGESPIVDKKIYGVAKTLRGAIYTRDYYTQTGWATSDGGSQAHDLSESYTSNSALTLYPVWTANQYSVTHTLTDSHVTCTSGATGANAATHATNYVAVFARTTGYDLPSTITVTINGNSTTSGTEYTWNQGTGTVTINGSYITGNIVITVTGTLASHTLAWSWNGGSTSATAVTNYTAGGSVNYGTSLTYPANNTMSKTGYDFSGWSSSPSTMPDNDLTITAQWTAKTYTVTLDPDNSASTVTVTATYDAAMPSKLSDGETDLEAPSFSNYTFGGYFDDHCGAGTKYFTNAVASANAWDKTSNTTLYALWTQSITLDREGATTGSTSVTATYKSATLPSITNPEKDGYTFEGWYDGDDGTGNLVISKAGALQANVSGYTGAGGIWTSSSTRTLHAKWTAKTYTITLDDNGGSADGSATATYNSTSLSSISAPTYSGHTVDGYYTSANCTTKVATDAGALQASITVSEVAWTNSSSQWKKDGTATFYAHWKCNTPTITDNGDNTVTITVPAGTTVRYTTDGTDPSSSSGTVYTDAFDIDEDVTVKAIAIQDDCTDSEVASVECKYSGGGGDCEYSVIASAVLNGTTSTSTLTGGTLLASGLDGSGPYKLKSMPSWFGMKLSNNLQVGDSIIFKIMVGDWWAGKSASTVPIVVFAGKSLDKEIYRTSAIAKNTDNYYVRFVVTQTMIDSYGLTDTVMIWRSQANVEDCTECCTQNHKMYSMQVKHCDKTMTEPTVTWSGVPATVYPGQQFTFTVETNTDATLAVGNLTATNATLVNISEEGGVFTATAQIAADAAAAPTFTLSTAEGTTYSAKVDTKSGITLGSCESSSGTATLFAFTCTASTTAKDSYTATGGTATLSGNPMSTDGSNEITISEQTYYKFNSSSLWTMVLSSGTFAVGDVITFTMACNSSSAKNGKGVELNGSIEVTTDYPKNTAQTSSYTVVADDGIAGQSSFTIKRNDSDIKFGTVTVTREGSTLDNKQETTIEWPETVDGVREVEFEEGKKVPSLAIISSIGEATYTSNNEDVGSFREGKVELNGGYGNVTITVSVAETGCMKAAESSYVLTVTPKRYTVEKGTITGTGCDVTLSATSVPAGEAVTLTPVPAAGYSLTSWDVYKKGDSSTKVTVTNNRFTMPAYDVVVNATFSAKSSVATLSALSVTNADTEEAVTLSPTFASGTTEYTATLSCGTTSAPSISATKTDSKATTRLTNVSDLSGDAAARTATIVVTAEDGETTQTYTIVFTVSAEGCVRLAPSITSISEGEDICSGGTVDLSVTAESRNNDGGTLSYQWQKYNGASWDNIAGATAADYTTDAIIVSSKFRCVVTDTKDASAESTTSDEITIGVTSVDTPTYTQSANVVTLSCATEGATIWYSTDGNNPAAGADNSRQGTSVSITHSDVTVKAIAYLEGCRSAVMTLENADYSSGAVDGSITWAMTNAGKKEAPTFGVTCVPNTVLSAATAFTMQNEADYEMSTKSDMSVKISGITSYSADGKHVSLDVTVADGYTFTPCSLSVTYQPVSKAAKYIAVIGTNTSSESESVSAGSTATKTVTFSTPKSISGTEALHLYVYGTDLTRWRLAGNIILYGTVQTTGTTYYSVTYNRNGATSGTIPVDDNLYESGETVELAANTGNLAKTGYIFSGWSTTGDGDALTENPTITSDMTLYAVWTEDASLVTEVCDDVETSGTHSSIDVGGYSLYFSSSNTEYNEKSVKSSTANTCEGDYRYYMPGVVVALTNSNATTIKLKGQQDYDVTVSKVMVADALDGAWKEISFTPVAYTGTSCGEVGISGVQIAQGKYVFLGFTGGAKDEFRISGLCITPFTDPCPSISIVNNPVGDTWAKDAAGVQISVRATTDAGVLSYQWQVSSDNTNFSDIDAATATTYDVPTGTVGTKYYRCVVSNGSCSKNSGSAKMVIIEPTVTALYDYWYIKQSRQTPDIALFEVTKGTPASNVTIPSAEIGQYGFVYNTSDYKVYLQGSAPSAIYSDEDVEVTASIKSNSNSDNITLHLLRATPHPQLAFVVTGDKGAGFENYDADQITSDLYTQLALDYIIQPTNVYHTTDEKAIRAYYSQFDIILNTDYPDTQIGPNSNSGQWNVGYVNALGTMVDIVPILTMEAFISRLPNWKIKHDPKSPSTNQYAMLLNCRSHEIFSGIPAANMETEMINDEEYKRITIVDENGYDSKKKALQGFSAEELSDMDIVGQIHDGEGRLMACVERQYETTARMMVLGINSSAMVKLTEDGIKVVKNALRYLQHKNSLEVNDCSLRFDNSAGDNKWSTVENWAPAYNALPSHENKVIILTDCELDVQAHVDMVKINEDAKLTIQPTGALIVDGTITRFSGDDWLAQDGDITSDNLAIEADAEHTGALILSNPEGKIGAEVQMYSKSHWETVDGKKKKYWSYVGVPVANVDIPNYFNQGFTYLYTETGGWVKKGDGSVLQPFEGIGLSMQSGNKETFYGALASTLTRKIALTKTTVAGNGENLIGNSWTAPIQIANFETTDFGGATATVYVYNTGRDEQASGSTGTVSYGGTDSETAGQWVSVPIETAKEGGYTGLKVIPAMNAFQVNTSSAATLTLDYDKLVRKSATSNDDINEPMRAPRRAASRRIDALMRIRVSGEKTHTDIWLQQDDRFSDGFDNGWEATYAECDNRSAQLYAVSMLGQMSFIAKPYLEGTPIGFAPSRDGNAYTFSFQYDGEDVYYLNDLKEQKSTLIDADETYTFTYEEGEITPRFLISAIPYESPAITTGIENLDKPAPKVQKIIYNDKLYIIRGGRVYSADGQVVK